MSWHICHDKKDNYDNSRQPYFTLFHLIRLGWEEFP